MALLLPSGWRAVSRSTVPESGPCGVHCDANAMPSRQHVTPAAIPPRLHRLDPQVTRVSTSPARGEVSRPSLTALRVTPATRAHVSLLASPGVPTEEGSLGHDCRPSDRGTVRGLSVQAAVRHRC